MTTGNSSNSRSDFIPEQSASTLTYGRGGGCFVSRGKAALLAAAVVAAVVLAAAFGRYVWAPAPPPVVHVPSVTMTTGAADSGEGDRRLPQDVQSVRYQLHLWPVLDHAPENKTAFTFEGRLALTVKVEADDGADRISLHAASTLTVQEKDIVLVEWSHEAEVVGAYWELFPPRIYPKSMDGVFKTIPVSVTRTPALDLLDVHPERRLAQGERYVVFIRFNGTLGDSLTGLYRSSYTDDLTQQKRWLAVTHMQPTYAREAFPCMDEPSFRARFRLTIACRDGTSAIANAPLLQYTPIAGAPGWTWHQFEESVPMPTYLVAFAITDFKCIYPTKRSANPLSGLNRLNVTSAQGIKTQINDLDDLQKLSLLLLQLQARTARKSIEETEEVEVRLCARPSVLQNGRFAVDITPKLLDYFGDYFGVAYPLPKMDLLAIPDFDMGAMENWGLIIFREFHLLVDEEADGVAAVELVAETVAHELAHQWLGNLVTPEWWNELWLNEGFAVYVQSAAVDFVQPTWKTQARFQTSVLQSSLLDDSSEATRAIAASVHSKDDITQAFDAIAYKKGACLLRMLHHSLGDAAFRLGVASYMRTWQHNSTTESRLWEPLTDAVEATPSADTDHQRLPDNATVAEVMASWTRVEGYPVVNVTLDRTTGKITFTQELFLARAWRRHCCRKYSSPQLWYVPLSFATRSAAARNASVLEDTRPRVWLVNRTLDVQLESPPGPDDWLVVNLHQTGYFRVNYDLDNWRLLTAQLRANHTALPAGVRAQLLSDALSLASAGQLPYAVALNLTLYLPRRELDPLPWSAALSALGVMSKALSGQPELVIFERYMQRLLNPTWSRVAPSDPATVAEPSISTTSMEALSHEALLHRAEVVSWACEVHLDKCEDWAYRAVHLWRLQPETRNSVPVLLRPTAYCSAVATGSPDVWDFMWRQYLAVRASPGQQAIILQALACTSDPARAASLLAKALDDADIRQQDVGLVWQAAASEPVASLVEFRYLREHWPDIYNKFGASSLVSTSVLSAATLSLTTESDLQDLKVFRAEHNDTLGAVSRSLALGEENLKTEIEWRRKYFPDVRKWMEAALQNPHVFN